MAKVLRIVGTIAGAVAMVVPGLQGLGVAITAGMKTVASVATIVATVANIGAQLLQKPPAARGSVTDVELNPDASSPYPIGRTYVGGAVRYDVGYGGKVSDVWNPYRFTSTVYSVAGPIEAFETFVLDHRPLTRDPVTGSVSGYYDGKLWIDAKRGLRPETALTPHWPGCPKWSAAHKLSGKAALGWSFKFDKRGKVFAAGIGQPGVVGKWVWAYDPRKDSTYPGGSGTHRWDDELSWSWTENAALHALTYLRGRYINGHKVIGVGMERRGIIVSDFVAAANVFDANGWACGGIVFEPSNRWDNLRAILWSGGAVPLFAAGQVGCMFPAPRIAVDTIRLDDVVGDVRIQRVRSYRTRINTLIPKYRSEANQWSIVEAATAKVAAFVTEDGEERIDTDQRDFVQDATQATQLATYRLYDDREGPLIAIPLHPRFRAYRPGNLFTAADDLPLPIAGKNLLMLRRGVDVKSGVVTGYFRTDNPTKHGAVLTRVGVAPPPDDLPDIEALDGAAFDNGTGSAVVAVTAAIDSVATQGGFTMPSEYTDFRNLN